MSDEEYNGWSNRETWAINLHLENNQGDYLVMCEKAKEIVEEDWSRVSKPKSFGCGDPNCDACLMDRPIEDQITAMVGEMADYIKEWTEEVFALVLEVNQSFDGTVANSEARSFVADVGSWWRADFYEIAEHWINDAREES